MPDLIVRTLSADRLAQAYPLIRSATRVSLSRWEEFGADLVRAGGGVLAVSAPDSCVHGVAAYRPGPKLRHESCLDVEVIVAFELRGNDLVRKTLCRELERIAVEQGCATLNFTVDAKNAGASSRARCGLERMGLKLDTASFVRELPGARG